MSTITTRSGKGSGLTSNEVDANFTNLNTDKLQSGDTAAALTVTSFTFGSTPQTMTAYVASVESALTQKTNALEDYKTIVQTSLLQMASTVTDTNTRYITQNAFA